MKGFKDSTKTQYAMGGSCYAKGGSVKGAAKVSKVMGEFKSGKLHSGSKEGPEVKNPKQAVAIALSEARKAGAKIPVKKAMGGSMDESTSSRPTIKGRPMTDEELSTPDMVMRSVGRADPYEKMPPRMAKGDDFRKAHGLEVTKTTVKELPMRRGPAGAGFNGSPVVSVKPMVNAMRSALKEAGFKKGGLAVMPRGKKC